MSVENIRPYTQEEAVRKSIVDSLIELSRTGEINWDFSLFDNSSSGQEARAEYEGVEFISLHWQDTGEELVIVTGEGENRETVNRFGGQEARRLRDTLRELAQKDPNLKEIRRQEKDKNRRRAEARRENLEKNAEKLSEIDHVLKTQI